MNTHNKPASIVAESTKAPKNTVQIATRNGYLRLQLPRALHDGKQKFISLGLKDAAENRELADIKRLEVEKDVKAQLLGFNAFDFSFEKYTGVKRPDLTVIQDINSNQAPPKTKLNLGELWAMWVEYRKPMLEQTTFLSKWRTYDNILKPVSHLELNAQTVQAIYQHVITASKNSVTIKKLLSQLHQAYERALALEMADGKNHFYGMVDEAKKVVQPYKQISVSDEDSDIRAFSREEMETILNYLREAGNKWYDFTKFRFLTGCRIGEAIALRWRHIGENCSYIKFGESYDSKFKITKCTKNNTVRRFPCNAGLRQFLLSIKPENPSPDEMVFKSPTSKQINGNVYYEAWHGRFDTKCKDEDGKSTWRPGFIEKLVNNGKLRQYLKPYATRHTFITLMIDAGVDMLMIASMCENSPDIILKHYYQKNPDFGFPELSDNI